MESKSWKRGTSEKGKSRVRETQRQKEERKTGSEIVEKTF